MPKPSNHLFEIEILLQNISTSDIYLDLVLPVWRSGRYYVLNFSSGIQEFSVIDLDSNNLKWEKINKSTWRVETSDQKNIKVKYKVYANDFALRTRGLNDEHGFIDASAVLMYPEAFKKSPIEVKIIPFKNWHVTTGLDRLHEYENIFIAKDYDYLADCPLEIGTQKDFEFTVQGKKHIASFSGEGNYNADTIIKDLTRIINTNYNFWGDLPYEHYTFIFHLTTQDGGATEHINSSINSVSPFLFSNSDRYYSFLSSICSHEFFHTWNAKQIRPKGLKPYDFTKENYTEELWIVEGLTSYYQNIILLKAGYEYQAKFLDNLQSNIKTDLERPGNRIQSLAEGSFDAWVKHWSSTQNKFDAETDYYRKGANVGLLLDLEIRNSSNNKYSLDDVMLAMYKRFPLEGVGYTNEDFIKVCEEYGGINLKTFFDSYLYGVSVLNWEKYLLYAGLVLKKIEEPMKVSLGINTREAGDRIIITYVLPESPAYDAGLNINDEIVGLDNYRIRNQTLHSRISDMNDGDIAKLTIIRNDKLKELEVIVKNIKSYSYKIEKVKKPINLQKTIYESWLYDKW